VSMAHALGLQVVAEGVETPAQRDFLARLGCNHGQGYLFGKPAPADQLHWLPAVGETGSLVV
jgi:EAL domain-containing protein (putative c-di-GMP-specific phosphodiesterase class I)